MGDIVRFGDWKRKSHYRPNDPIVKKFVDGEVIECVNFDALTPVQQSTYLASLSQEGVHLN